MPFPSHLPFRALLVLRSAPSLLPSFSSSSCAVAILADGSARSASTSARTSPDSRVATNDPLPPRPVPNVSETNQLPTSSRGATDADLVEMKDPDAGREMQAPNRAGVWSRSQMPREQAMSGPRFEQTMMHYQPRPFAAIELIHKQPVRWSDARTVSCDGGGGPLGHPRVFINLDRPEVSTCTYCGLPFAKNQHRKYLESLPSTPYPLRPLSDAAEVDEPMRVTDEPFAQR